MPRRPKLLILFTQVFADGGVQRFNRTLLAASERLDVDCDVYSLNDVAAPMLASNISVTTFGRGKARFARAVLDAIWRQDYAAVLIGHVNFVELVALALRCRPFHRPATLLITHGVDVWSGIKGMRRLALRAVDTILCVSRYTQRMIQRQAPELRDDRYLIFPNALNASWEDAARRNDAGDSPGARRLHLPDRFLLSVARISRLDRAKGIITVIETLPMLDDSRIHYVIAGDGDDRHFLDSIAARVGMQDRIHFLGTVSDEELVQLYRRCAAFVLPTGQEGFGIVFLEAMYFGSPVVAAAEKGAVDVVRHEHTGLLVDFGDVVRLKAAIDRVLGDNELRERLRAEARTTVTQGGPFTFAAFAERWSDIVHRHLEG